MAERIKENRDFRRIYNKGTALVSPCAVVYFHKNRFSKNRLGVACSKKTGKAVSRNRAKRVLRAAFAQVDTDIVPGYDFILVARSVTAEKKSMQVALSIREMLDKAGLIDRTKESE